MTREEYDELSKRLTELNVEIERLTPGGLDSMDINSPEWSQVQPLIDEHHEIMKRLRDDPVTDQ
ncbi:MAG: hypothetical protein AAFN16_04730 [Pseudomonadota bacterium]